MKSSYLAGACLGLVAAVVFASATTGPMVVRLVLLFLTPLPIALAGLGWGWRSAVVAGGAGTGVMAALAGPVVAIAFAITQAAPMVVLTYLALLSRPLNDAPDNAPGPEPQLEWYPAGRLVLWAAAMAGLMAVGSLMLIGGDLEELRKSLSEFLRTAVANGLPEAQETVKLSDTELAALSEIALSVLPAASAMSWMGSLLLNVWLAGRVTLASGQLQRPWPDLAAITFPQGTPLVFGLALLGTILAEYPGLAASAFAGGLFLAYLLLGLAIMHYTTRGKPWRPFALWGLYGALLVGNIWIGIVITMLGLSEAVLHLRARASLPPGPPHIHPSA